MSTNIAEPSLRITISKSGVQLVEFVGSGWEDEPETSEIYERIKSLIREIDRTLKISRGLQESPAIH